MNRWTCFERTLPIDLKYDLTATSVLRSSDPWRCLLACELGLGPVGLVTHEETPPSPYFYTFWSYLPARGTVAYRSKLARAAFCATEPGPAQGREDSCV